jgi:hypothetical protein
MKTMDSDLPAALDELIELIRTMPGAFRGEFELGFWGGVTEGADAWHIRVEADIEDTEFFLTAPTPIAALRRAVEETNSMGLCVPRPRICAGVVTAQSDRP